MKMKMMLEVRNKAINAYKELLKTQIWWKLKTQEFLSFFFYFYFL
jgi:hypothetical protein